MWLRSLTATGATICCRASSPSRRTAANKAVIEQMKGSAVRKSAKEKVEAEELATQLSEVELVFERKVGENDHLFGSVTSGDIAHAA